MPDDNKKKEGFTEKDILEGVEGADDAVGPLFNAFQLFEMSPNPLVDGAFALGAWAAAGMGFGQSKKNQEALAAQQEQLQQQEQVMQQLEAQRLAAQQQQFRGALPTSNTDSSIRQSLEGYGQQLNSGQSFNPLVEADKESVDYIMEIYMKKVEAEGWNSKGWYKAPVTNEDGSTQFSFPTNEAAMGFFNEMAGEGKAFAVLDSKTKDIIAYSIGDGTLHDNLDNLSREELTAKVKAVSQSSGPTMS